MLKESDILYENENYWVCASAKGYEVYEVGVTCSTRKAIIGHKGNKGLETAKMYCDRYSKENK